MQADGCVIFIHLPKTGGRTLAAALRYKYPSRTLFLDSLYEPLERIEEIPLERRRAARAVTGHLHYGVHRHMPQRCEYITMLRDPVARVVSMYRFIRDNPSNWLHDEVVGSGMGLEEFVRRAADPTAENLQTRLLAGLGPGEVMALGADGRLRAPEKPPPPVTEDDLARAKRNLDRFLVVGLTERFDESFILIRRALGWRLPMYESAQRQQGGPAGPADSDGDRADPRAESLRPCPLRARREAVRRRRGEPGPLVPARGGGVQGPEPDPERDRAADTNPLAPPGAGGPAALTATVSPAGMRSSIAP